MHNHNTFSWIPLNEGGTHSQSLTLLTRQLYTKVRRRAQTTQRLSYILLTSIWGNSISLLSVKTQHKLNTEKAKLRLQGNAVITRKRLEWLAFDLVHSLGASCGEAGGKVGQESESFTAACLPACHSAHDTPTCTHMCTPTHSCIIHKVNRHARHIHTQAKS